MDNRERDKVSRNNNSSTDAGEVNRDTSQRQGQRQNESDANFGQNIGRPENQENEPNRGPGNDSSYSGGGKSGRSPQTDESSMGEGNRGSSRSDSGSEH